MRLAMSSSRFVLFTLLFITTLMSKPLAASSGLKTVAVPSAGTSTRADDDTLFSSAEQRGLEVATLAGGCFWGLEDILRKLPGVVSTRVGYTGGKTEKATYDIVHTGATGHAESVQILFDPKKTTYEKILLEFFRMHDPTTVNRQGNDVGTQYRSAIFYANERQKQIAEKVKSRVEKSAKWKKPIVTEISPAGAFWRAEEYHQKYLEKNPGGYTCHYVRDFKF